MRTVGILFLIIFTSCSSNVGQKIVRNPDVKASFSGGEEALGKFVKENYSWKQEHKTVEGIVYVKFVVEKDGTISNVGIEKSLCESCDKHAIELIERMPKWVPALKRKKPVRSVVVLPIRYSLEGI